MADLQITPIAEIKALVELLAEMGIDPLSLNARGATPLEPRSNMQLHLRTRTDFEAVCRRLGAKGHERKFPPRGQRSWWAEADTGTRKLLIQCVSFEHHDDWEPRTTGGVR